MAIDLTPSTNDKDSRQQKSLSNLSDSDGKENISQNVASSSRTTPPRFDYSRISRKNTPARYISPQTGNIAPLLSGVLPSPPADKKPIETPSSSPESKVSRFYGNNTLTSSSTSAFRPPKRVPLSSLPRGSDINKDERRPSHLIGFKNLGNTCYMNSVLQALLGLPAFITGLIEIKGHVKASVLCRRQFLSTIGRLASFKLQGRQCKIEDCLEMVKKALVQKNPDFAGYRMQDAHEFLMCFLDSCHNEEIMMIEDKSIVNYFPEYLSNAKDKDNSSLIHYIFEYHIVETKTCSNCDNTIKSEVKECIKMLTPGGTGSGLSSIEDLLIKTMNSTQSFQCDECTAKRKELGLEKKIEITHEIVERFTKLPKTLILYYPRTVVEIDGDLGAFYRKNRDPIHVSECIDIDRFIGSETPMPPVPNTCSLKRPSDSESDPGTPAFKKMPRLRNISNDSKGSYKSNSSGGGLPTPEKIAFDISIESKESGKSNSSGGALPTPERIVFDDDFDDEEVFQKNISIALEQSLAGSDHESTNEMNGNTLQQDLKPLGPLSISTGGGANGNLFPLDSVMDFGDFATPLAAENTSKRRDSNAHSISPSTKPSSLITPPKTDDDNLLPLGATRENFVRLSSPNSSPILPEKSIGNISRNGKATEYRLTAVVSHIGDSSTIESGHYVADVYNLEKRQWFRYSDNQPVQMKTLNEVKEDNLKDGCIFIYTYT